MGLLARMLPEWMMVLWMCRGGLERFEEGDMVLGVVGRGWEWVESSLLLP